MYGEQITQIRNYLVAFVSLTGAEFVELQT